MIYLKNFQLKSLRDEETFRYNTFTLLIESVLAS